MPGRSRESFGREKTHSSSPTSLYNPRGRHVLSKFDNTPVDFCPKGEVSEYTQLGFSTPSSELKLIKSTSESFCHTKVRIPGEVARDDSDPEEATQRRAQERGPDRLSSDVDARLISHPRGGERRSGRLRSILFSRSLLQLRHLSAECWRVDICST